jgi:hypothetical protein
MSEASRALRALPGALLGVCLLGAAALARAEESRTESASQLRWLDPSSPEYKTPRAGEGFRTKIFGRDVEVEPRDRRSTSAWDVGLAGWAPWPDARAVLPFGSLYFFRRPDEGHFFRGTVVGLYNDLTYANSFGESPFELVLGFQNQTIPFDQSEYVDGEKIDNQSLMRGNLRGAVGVGYRRQVEGGFGPPRRREGVDPQTPDNMFSLSATLEPEFLYFKEGKEVGSDFTSPENTFALQGRLALRWDALERNLLDLSHSGYALGFDATQGWRAEWEDWGIDESEQAGDGRLPRLAQAYAVVAAGVPGASERHRLIGSVHGGWGGNTDRFSAPRLGGGPGGDEFGALARPLVPGVSLGEYYPDHYGVAIAEYRYELFFFSYLSARASAAYLDRDRLDTGQIHRENNGLASLGSRLTTGFVFKTRLQLDYNYNFDVIRDDDERGGSEIVLHVSRQF